VSRNGLLVSDITRGALHRSGWKGTRLGRDGVGEGVTVAGIGVGLEVGMGVLVNTAVGVGLGVGVGVTVGAAVGVGLSVGDGVSVAKDVGLAVLFTSRPRTGIGVLWATTVGEGV
jgi:hypothetical protein